VTAAASGAQSQPTAPATSSGAVRVPRGITRTSIARASSGVFPRAATTFRTAASVMSVSV